MDESAEDLRQKFAALLSRRFKKPNLRWLALWKLFVEHPWYDDQLDGCAHYVLDLWHLPADLLDDIKQSGRLLLGKSLQRAPNLHIDPKRAKSHFEPWLRTIIIRDCHQAARKLVDRHLSGTAIPDEMPYEPSDILYLELAEAFHKAVQQLSERQQSAVLLV